MVTVLIGHHSEKSLIRIVKAASLLAAIVMFLFAVKTQIILRHQNIKPTGVKRLRQWPEQMIQEKNHVIYTKDKE